MAAAWDTSRWMVTASAICLPIVIVGLSEVIGSWKTIPTWSPRTWRIASSLKPTRSTPSSRTSPPAMKPPRGSRRMIDIAAIVLPHPDSPTMPTVSPASTSKDSPSTACTTELRSRIRVRRSDTSSSCATGRYLS